MGWWVKSPLGIIGILQSFIPPAPWATVSWSIPTMGPIPSSRVSSIITPIAFPWVSMPLINPHIRVLHSVNMVRGVHGCCERLCATPRWAEERLGGRRGGQVQGIGEAIFTRCLGDSLWRWRLQGNTNSFACRCRGCRYCARSFGSCHWACRLCRCCWLLCRFCWLLCRRRCFGSSVNFKFHSFCPNQHILHTLKSTRSFWWWCCWLCWSCLCWCCLYCYVCWWLATMPMLRDLWTRWGGCFCLARCGDWPNIMFTLTLSLQLGSFNGKFGIAQ